MARNPDSRNEVQGIGPDVGCAPDMAESPNWARTRRYHRPLAAIRPRIHLAPALNSITHNAQFICQLAVGVHTFEGKANGLLPISVASGHQTRYNSPFSNTRNSLQ